MSSKNQILPEEQQAKLIEMLNRRLADAIDLQLQSRQAYWNVKRASFMDLRKLFDQVAQGVEEDANLIAERIVQLGGTAEGTARAAAGRSALDGSALAAAPGSGLIDALAQTLTTFGRHARDASEQATLLQDVRDGCPPHPDRPWHRHLALVRPDQPASGELSGVIQLPSAVAAVRPCRLQVSAFPGSPGRCSRTQAAGRCRCGGPIPRR